MSIVVNNQEGSRNSWVNITS